MVNATLVAGAVPVGSSAERTVPLPAAYCRATGPSDSLSCRREPGSIDWVCTVPPPPPVPPAAGPQSAPPPSPSEATAQLTFSAVAVPTPGAATTRPPTRATAATMAPA